MFFRKHRFLALVMGEQVSGGGERWETRSATRRSALPVLRAQKCPFSVSGLARLRSFINTLLKTVVASC